MIIMGKINLDGGGIAVTLNEKSGISPLKGDGESLEEKLNFFRVVFSPSSRTLTRHVLQKLNRSRVPSAKSLDNEGLKDNPLRATIVKMKAIFCCLPHLDGGGGKVGGAV